MTDEIVKEYTNGEITVVWKPKTCIHSKKCWKGLIEVFDPREKPWVNMEGADSETIMKQIDACPSGALSYRKNDSSETPSDTNKTSIEVTKNGPLLVKGTIDIVHSNGESESKAKTTAFCRCGMSSNKPFCDGTHRKENWTED